MTPQSSGTAHAYKHTKYQELTDHACPSTGEFARLPVYFGFFQSSAWETYRQWQLLSGLPSDPDSRNPRAGFFPLTYIKLAFPFTPTMILTSFLHKVKNLQVMECLGVPCWVGFGDIKKFLSSAEICHLGKSNCTLPHNIP